MDNYLDDNLIVRKVTRIGEGRFQLESVLAEGGQAKVWKGKEIAEPQRDVAVKLVTCDLDKRDLGDPSIHTVFTEEARTWAEFQRSPYVVQLYYSFCDQFTEGGRDRMAMGFVMEFSPEGDLGKYIRSGVFDLGGKKQTRNFLLDIAQALKAGHDKDIVHGDIKARNVILFKQSGTLAPKLMDFGMAISTDTARLRGKGGTPEYMAPELFDHKPPSKESDIYALGILFFEIVCGKLPHVAVKRNLNTRWADYELLHRSGNVDFNLVENSFDKNLADLIRGMMACNPNDRIKLSKVIGHLKRQQDDEIRASTRNPDLEAVLLPRTYRWNPNLHELMNNRLFYFFIKGSSPTGDLKWFKNNLSERGIHGYSLYRVLGGFDYVLRVWLKHPYEEELEALLKNFRDAHNGDYVRFGVNSIGLFAQPQTITAKSSEEALMSLSCCADADPEQQFQKLFTKGLVSSRFEENCSYPIRFFLAISAGHRPPEFLLKAYAQEFSDALRKDGTAKDLSVYQGEGDFNLLLKFRLSKFEEFRKVYDVFLSTSVAVRIGDSFLNSQTYVEMDPSGFIESDDGSLIAQLNEYVRGD